MSCTAPAASVLGSVLLLVAVLVVFFVVALAGIACKRLARRA